MRRAFLAGALAVLASAAPAQMTRDAKSAPEAKSVAVASDQVQVYLTQDKKVVSVWMAKADVEKSFAEAVVATVRAGEEPRYFHDLRTYNRFLVQDCAEHVKEGERARVERNAEYVCRERPFILANELRVNRVAYDVWRDKKGIKVGVSVRFMTSEDKPAERELELVEKITATCPEKMAGLLRRYGIGFEADFLVIRNPSVFATNAKTEHPEIRVDLVDAFGRSDAAKYYYYGQKYGDCVACVAKKAPCPAACTGEVSDEFCATMAHELGHSLGLPDEYKDASCPDSKTWSTDSDPWSLMDDTFQPWQSVELFPRHLAAVLMPLCRSTGAVLGEVMKPYFLAYRKVKKQP